MSRSSSRIGVIVLLLIAFVTLVWTSPLGYSQTATTQSVTAPMTTTTSISTLTETNVSTTTSVTTYNYTSTTTTSMITTSDVTTIALAAVAVAALVIAVFALMKRRGQTMRPGSTAPMPYSGLMRALVCPSCGTSNKPGANFCRRCRTRLQ